MTIALEGEHTTARVLVDDESLFEDNCLAQIQELVDHPAFTEPVRVMPDTHWGADAPIGFTMPLPDRVVPNIVGVDVDCGMAATTLGDELPLSDAEREPRHLSIQLTIETVVPSRPSCRREHRLDTVRPRISRRPSKRSRPNAGPTRYLAGKPPTCPSHRR